MFGLDPEDINLKQVVKVLDFVNLTRETLHQNCEKISQLRDDFFQKKRLIALKKKELSSLQDRLKSVIASETDGRGKPLYSNEIKRQAEFLERSANDAACLELEQQLDALMASSAEAENKFESLSFEQEIHLLDFKLGLRVLDILPKILNSTLENNIDE